MERRVLFVENEAPIRELFRRWLVKSGYVCILAESAEEAWVLIDSGERFHAIISDKDMSGMSGVELLKLVRWNLRVADTPFFLISGNVTVSKEDQTSLSEACKVLNATFIPKPMVVRDLITRHLDPLK